jgi:diguanylate cyclase (GGDEF)-like protein
MGKRLKQNNTLASAEANCLGDCALVQQLMTCVEIGKALTSTLDMERILVIILKRLNKLIRAKNWSLFLLDPQTRKLHFEVVVGLDKRSLGNMQIRLGEGIAGTVALTGEPILVPDVHKDPRFSGRVDHVTGFITRSLICLPLKLRGSIIGALEVVNPEDASLFRPDSMPVLSILADYVAIAINNARNYEKIESLSITDEVTGLYNTRFLHQYLDQLLGDPSAQAKEVSLVFLDLDDFKEVVDTHGHLAGSKVLKEVAEVMAAGLDDEDRIFRYGGDEYVIILPGQDKKAALNKIITIRKSLAESIFLKDEGLQIKVTASFGIANYPHDATNQRELLHIADNSMYHSKAQGKDSITLA